MQLDDLTVARIAFGTVVLTFLGTPRREHRHRSCRGRLLWQLALGHRRCRLFETGVLSGEEPLDGFAQVLQEVPAVSHLHGVRRAIACPFGVLGVCSGYVFMSDPT